MSFALSGLGGTRLFRGDGFPGPIIGKEQISFGSVLGDLLSNDFPNRTVGVTMAYPLSPGVAVTNLARARLQRTQTQLARRNLGRSQPRSAMPAATSP